MPSEQPHVAEPWGAREHGFEEPPAILWCTGQIQRQLAKDAALTSVATVCHEGSPQFAPPRCLAHIDQTTDPALPERKDGMSRLDLEVAE
jgi:hypothetical protein